MFTFALILFHREAHLVWFPWQPCGGVFNLLQSISYWFFFFFCCWSHSSGYRLKKNQNCLFACTRSMWFFILEVILQLKSKSVLVLTSLPPSSLHFPPLSLVFTPHPPGLIVSGVKATGKSVFHLYFCTWEFCFCIFGLVKLWKYKAFLGSSSKIMLTELVTSHISSWGPVSSLL